MIVGSTPTTLLSSLAAWTVDIGEKKEAMYAVSRISTMLVQEEHALLAYTLGVKQLIVGVILLSDKLQKYFLMPSTSTS